MLTQKCRLYKKLQIVEDDECSDGKVKAEDTTLDAKSSTNPVLKIGSNSALKFRALIEYECVQSFIHEADYLIPRLNKIDPIHDVNQTKSRRQLASIAISRVNFLKNLVNDSLPVEKTTTSSSLPETTFNPFLTPAGEVNRDVEGTHSTVTTNTTHVTHI